MYLELPDLLHKWGLDATKKGESKRFEKIRVPEAAAFKAEQVLAKKR